MVRFLILGVALTIALSIYAVVDCAMSEPRRIRVFQKQLWLIIVLLLPLVGPVCWILFGKGLITVNAGGGSSAGRDGGSYGGQRAPDDDSEFLRRLRDETADERLKRLEEELASLDEVTFPPPADHAGGVDAAKASADSGVEPTDDGTGPTDDSVDPQHGDDSSEDDSHDTHGRGSRHD